MSSAMRPSEANATASTWSPCREPRAPRRPWRSSSTPVRATTQSCTCSPTRASTRCARCCAARAAARCLTSHCASRPARSRRPTRSCSGPATSQDASRARHGARATLWAGPCASRSCPSTRTATDAPTLASLPPLWRVCTARAPPARTRKCAAPARPRCPATQAPPRCTARQSGRRTGCTWSSSCRSCAASL